MTFPNRINYRLRPREKSQHALTAPDAVIAIDATFSPLHIATREDDDNDVEMKPETLTWTSAFHHSLLPLTRKLMAMISQPTELLAALVVDCSESPLSRTSKQTFWARAVAFQHSELQGVSSGWYRILEDVEQYELSSVDVLMLKAALYYWHLWQHVCNACVEAVTSIEETATNARGLPKPQPQQQRLQLEVAHSSFSSLLQKRPFGEQYADALSQGMILSGSGMAKRSRITKKSNEFLVAWFLAHKDNPYPSPAERVEIADKTGLAEQQVRNWFANMRKRHWKPNRANAKKPRCLLDYVLRQNQV